jgi:hypothetical protein
MPSRPLCRDKRSALAWSPAHARSCSENSSIRPTSLARAARASIAETWRACWLLVRLADDFRARRSPTQRDGLTGFLNCRLRSSRLASPEPSSARELRSARAPFASPVSSLWWFPGCRAFAAGTDLGNRRSPDGAVLHQSRASGRDLNFIGSTSGPLTTKWPLIIRMVSVVIALPPVFLRLAPHRWRVRVLELEPVWRAARAVARAHALRDNPLAAERAGLLEHDHALRMFKVFVHLRREPLETRKATLASVLRKTRPGLRPAPSSSSRSKA